MDKLLLVDGSNLLFQMFFGMPARIVGKNSKPIQGVLGFVGALLKIIKMTEPTHIAMLFDGEHENGRSLLDPAYKSNRADYGELPEEENPFSQLPAVYAALDYLGIKCSEADSCEADDVIAGYALTCGKYCEVVISSFDSDFFQLISPRVSVLRYRGKDTVLCTPKWFEEKFGITPAQYADFKALTGDSADAIKGAEQVGPKTAAALLREFGTLQDLLQNAEAVKKPSVRESIRKNADRLRINYRLIKLTNAAPLPFSLDELAYRPSEITTTEVLRGIGLK